MVRCTIYSKHLFNVLVLYVSQCRKGCYHSRWRGFYDCSTVARSQVEDAHSRARERAIQENSKKAQSGNDEKSVNTVTTQKNENGIYTITAYCPCVKCCGKTNGITASGVKAVEGVTVAMPKSIPFGTRIHIDGVGERIVQDRGGAIKGNKIDLYFDSHEEALQFGRQKRKVNILK